MTVEAVQLMQDAENKRAFEAKREHIAACDATTAHPEQAQGLVRAAGGCLKKLQKLQACEMLGCRRSREGHKCNTTRSGHTGKSGSRIGIDLFRKKTRRHHFIIWFAILMSLF